MPSRLTLSDLPARYQNQIAAQIAKGKPVGMALSRKLSESDKPAAKPLLRQKSGPALNKTEQAYLEHMRAHLATGSFIEPHALTLLLGNGVRYTPDFIVSDTSGLWAYEVKGHMRDDAAVKLKVAAGKFTFIKFVLVWRNGAQWGQQRIHA